MAEEVKPQDAKSTDETVTPGAEAQKNNTSSGSEADKTQKNADQESTAQKRIRQLVAERNGLEAKLKVYEEDQGDNKSSSQPVQGTDGDELREIRLELRSPAHLKNQVSQMAAFAKKHPTLSTDEVINFFDKTASQKSEAEVADEAANQSRTGGNSSSAVRQPSEDIKSLKDDELKAELTRRIKNGEKI